MGLAGAVLPDDDVEALAELELRLVEDGERAHLE